LILKIWGLGIGDWGLGIGDWGLGPIPNPQSPIKKEILMFRKIINKIIYEFIFILNIIMIKIEIKIIY